MAMTNISAAARSLNALVHDDAPSVLTRGYGFGKRIWQRVERGARSAPMRLLGHDAAFVRGVEGVSLFYDETRIARHGAMPALVQETLFGHGSVHSLDGDAHHHRKAAFVDSAYEDAQVERLTPWLEREWESERNAWLDGGTRSAYEAATGALGRAVMAWAGLPGTPAAKTRWSERLAQIVDGFGAPYSPAYALAVLNRVWSDCHSAGLIEAARAGALRTEPGTALEVWAHHRDQAGELLPARLAGVELQNSIRPMVAVARFVAFAAKELHDRPEWRERIAAETAANGRLVGGELATMFAQEIRRTAPFVPMLPGRTIADVEIDGQHVAAGGRVVLDILGTNTDEHFWANPKRFAPERFSDVEDFEALPAFIPHGGGDVATGHRCPGEKLAVAGLSAGVAVLSDPRLRILGSGLGVNRRRLPTMPRSGGRVRSADAPSRCPFS
ncbi:cytochrome P450 [Microbacterium aurantiacum]|uniref:cytochrome P450 n=1 Tax=Microbacterium aurantiacum TaxID=162393 RepID=UPI0032B1F554